MSGRATIHGELHADGKHIFLIAVGPDFRVAAAARLLATLTPLVKPTEPKGGMQIPLTWPAVVQLAEAFGKEWKPGPRLQAWIAEEFARRVNQVRPAAVMNLRGWTPRDYQLDGAALIAATGRAMLFDEPGVGKTASALLGLAHRASLGHLVTPVVVVCPASVVDPWLEQIEAWVPGWRAVAWRGTPSYRASLADDVGTIEGADVYVASYDTARIDTIGGERPRDNPLLKVRARSVVADEFHQLKNASTGRSKAVRKLAVAASQFVGLSGTPLTHSPADIWPTLEALAPGAWPSRERWVNRFCLTVRGDYQDTILGLAPGRDVELTNSLLGQQRRVAKADVLTQLPPKVYTLRTVELPPTWRKVYDEFESQMLAQLPELDDDAPLGASTELSVMDVLAQLTHLAGLANAAADVRVEIEKVQDPLTGLWEEKRHVHLDLKAPSWKVDALMEVLAERPGRPVIATAPSRQLMVLAGAAAEKAGLRVGYVMGGQKQSDRTAHIAAFQRGELDLICVSTGAGGVGITLTAADTVVFLARPWSLVESIQMEDRAHRMGSEIHESIEIIDIVAKNTIDSRVRAILRERAGQLSDFVKDPRLVEEMLGGDKVTRVPPTRKVA